MKKLYILILALIVTINLNAQSYIRMVDTTNIWDVLCGGITTNGEDFRQTDKLQFIGDTVVNDTIYHKLYAHVNYTSHDSAFRYICSLREDSAQQKIFRRNDLGAATTEELLYDFSLLPGDSLILSVDYYNRPNPIKIDSIISEYFAGKNRRVFYITAFDNMMGNWYQYNYEWIEGIGKVEDFGKIKGPVDDFEWRIDELLCFWNSGQMLYQNSNYLTCLIIHVGIDTVKANENYHIYPNPFYDYLIIETSQSIKESTMTIYSTTGQELINQQIKDLRTRLDIANFTSGIYFVKLVTDKEVIVEKIIKE